MKNKLILSPIISIALLGIAIPNQAQGATSYCNRLTRRTSEASNAPYFINQQLEEKVAAQIKKEETRNSEIFRKAKEKQDKQLLSLQKKFDDGIQKRSIRIESIKAKYGDASLVYKAYDKYFVAVGNASTTLKSRADTVIKGYYTGTMIVNNSSYSGISLASTARKTALAGLGGSDTTSGALNAYRIAVAQINTDFIIQCGGSTANAVTSSAYNSKIRLPKETLQKATRAASKEYSIKMKNANAAKRILLKEAKEDYKADINAAVDTLRYDLSVARSR